MKKQESRKLSPLFDNKGFTLIEMAIVLIIIGIIIGAIVKGKDIVKSAEQKKLYTKFVNAWSLTFNNYYDRTGWILGDDNTATNATRDGNCGIGGVVATEANLEAQLTAVGLELPPVGASGNTTDRNYKDSNGVLHNLALVFDYDAAVGNFIRITGTGGIPNDLGMALDRMVDGTMDGTIGDLLYTADNTATPIVTAAWPLATAALVANSAIIYKVQF
jgi:prepilin-type N-terminal cleavage/methylation domain-containing protein